MCDFQVYRYLVDDFVIEHYEAVDSKDFVLKDEDYSSNRNEKKILTKRRTETYSIAQTDISKRESVFLGLEEENAKKWRR